MSERTLKEAKQFLRENFEKGVACPCCDQFVKQYKRKLNSGMALFLIGLYKLYKRDDKVLSKTINSELHSTLQFYSNKEVFEVMSLSVTSLDYSVLRHFGLTEARVTEGTKRDSGHWRITGSGICFVEIYRNVSCHKYVYLYNNKRQGVSDEKITIQEALGSKFDYKELMG